MLGLFRRNTSAAQEVEATAGAAPQTYAQWSACLDELAHGVNDELCLARMGRGQLPWTGGVAPLFAQRLSDELQRRLQRCAERLTRDLGHSRAEAHVVHSILQARQQLFFMHRLCLLPTLPQDLRSQLQDEVQRFAERSQSSLLSSAKAERSGRLASLLQHNPITRYQDLGTAAQSEPIASPSTATQDTAPSARRRNILI